MEDHCPDCVRGFKVDAISKGKIEKFAGVDAYIATPSNSQSKNAIVIATDVFGHSFINVQVLADAMADETGYLVVVPDLFNGDPVPPEKMDLVEQEAPSGWFGRIGHSLNVAWTFASIIPWFIRHGKPAGKTAIVSNTIDELRNNHGIEKIGVIGYCYGGKIVVQLAATDLIDCYIAVHPSMLSFPTDIEAIKKPGMWGCAEIDRMLPAKSIEQVDQILTKTGMSHEMKVYPHAKHGFAIRGNENDEKVKKAKYDCAADCVNYLKQQLQ